MDDDIVTNQAPAMGNMCTGACSCAASLGDARSAFPDRQVDFLWPSW
jgi:hypothetical protein